MRKGWVSLDRKGGYGKTRAKEADERGKSIDSHRVGGGDSALEPKIFSPFVSV